MTSSRALARNSTYYFGTLAVPAVAALFLVPVTVRALGAPRFGLLALAWIVGEGVGMFDFGLGRATVRFVADAVARTSAGLRQIVSVSVVAQTVTGIIAGAALFCFAPLLVARVFSVPSELQAEAEAMFRVLALHVPLLFGMNAARAVLEGSQRFDLNAAVRIPSSLASIAVPAIAASLGASLATILWILLGARLAIAFLTFLAVSHALPDYRWEWPRDWRPLRALLNYSGWVAISTFLGPLLGNFDRFVLGAVRGVMTLGYYTGAAEAATRFLLLPVTAFGALLPALSASDTRGERVHALHVARAARRQLAAVSLPISIILVVLAPQILGVWLGPGFAAQSATALRILSVGVFATGLAHLPLALLYGSGRPDLPAKIHIAQVLLHVPVTIVAIRLWGLNGAAFAWAFRATQDLVAYEWVRVRTLGRPPADTSETARARHLTGLGALFALAIAGAALVYSASASATLAVTVIASVLYARLAWVAAFSESERSAWLSVVASLKPTRGTA